VPQVIVFSWRMSQSLLTILGTHISKAPHPALPQMQAPEKTLCVLVLSIYFVRDCGCNHRGTSIVMRLPPH
jgi:hypothetical protein